MGSTRKLASVVGVGLFAALALAGCIDPGSGFAVLDREADPSDALPADLPAYAVDDLEPTSSRFVGEHDGNALYLAKGKEAGRICLLVYPDDSASWVIGCGDAVEFGVGGLTGDYTVRPEWSTRARALHRSRDRDGIRRAGDRYALSRLRR